MPQPNQQLRVILRLTVGFCLGVLSACGNGGSGRYAEADDSYESRYASDEDAAASADAAAEDARQAVYEEAGADSEGADANASNVDPQEIDDGGDYSCTEDCSGHEAGFQWAQERGIDDTSNCGGRSQSFIEGCEAFANARQEEADRRTQEEAEQAADEARDSAEANDDAENYSDSSGY